jgi:hypothetical protein
MSANIAEVVITGTTFPNVLALPVSTNIGGIAVQTSIRAQYNDDLEITEHPVEAGAEIADHSYKKPSGLVLRCGWSNSSLAALTGIVTGLFSGGTMSGSDYVSGVYSQLLKLQESRQPLSVSTGKRQYENMLIRSLAVDEDKETSQALMVTATFKQIIIVSTQSTSLPAQGNQAAPADTAETQSVGSQQVGDAAPSPGGTAPPDVWGN